MHLSLRTPALALLLAACNAADPPASAPEGIACPLTERIRLAAPPDDFEPTDTYYVLTRIGDHLLFSFDAYGPGRTFWHTSRCGGPVEKFTALAPNLDPFIAITTAYGPVLYAYDPQGRVFVADRLDVPGFDAPREVTGLPPSLATLPSTGTLPLSHPFVLFTYLQADSSNVGNGIRDAAGVNAATRSIYTHTGDPDVPARLHGDTVVSQSILGDALMLLDDDGTLRRVDPASGASTVEQTGVRYFSLSPDLRRLIWQELGDDVAEAVHLRDLTTGDDQVIATNDFAAVSWGRLPDDPLHESTSKAAGRWLWTADGAFAALRGPDDTFVAAVRAATGEPLEVPPHAAINAPLTRHFSLVLADPTDHVDALWDPDTGDLVIWHRGPTMPTLRHLDPERDRADYLLPDVGRPDTGELVRVDLTTGLTTTLLEHLGSASTWLDDDRYLESVVHTQLEVPIDNSGSTITLSTKNYRVADLATGIFYPLADDIASAAPVPDGLLVLDAHGDDPGVWALPFPE